MAEWPRCRAFPLLFALGDYASSGCRRVDQRAAPPSPPLPHIAGDIPPPLAQKPRMKTSFVILIILAALATLAVLVLGVVTMARGKDVTGERSNKLMTYRVLFQAITIVLVGVLLYAMRGG